MAGETVRQIEVSSKITSISKNDEIKTLLKAKYTAFERVSHSALIAYLRTNSKQNLRREKEKVL